MRDDDIERRLLNWARWLAGPGRGGLGYTAPRYDDMPTTTCRESVIPTNGAEAAQTDTLVKKLPSECRRAVELIYAQACGVSKASKLMACGLSTVHARIDRAHTLLKREVLDAERIALEQRVGLEKRQSESRRWIFGA
ncbi:MAG: hypothetical protein ACRCV9_04040 [Burkholderiaceae bacterium]